MNVITANRVLEALKRIANSKKMPLAKKIERIDSLLSAQKCLRGCGRWQRGGRRQGSALCEECYRGES